MSELQELEANLAEAKADLARAAADVAKANALFPKTGINLCKTVTTLAKAQADLAKARADVDLARANCCRAAAALAEFKCAYTRQRLTQSSGCSAEKRTAKSSGTGKGIFRFIIHESIITDAITWRSSFVRPAMMLFVLIVAYLQYYFIGVFLEIALLPSLTVYT